MWASAFIALLLFTFCGALNNGVGRTPAMGWSSWNVFRCNISEVLVLDIARAMLSSGLQSAGYEYVNIDDCWMTPRRDFSGNLQADASKFPHGIKWLADELHGMGFKLGIYACPGEKTCLGFPGSYEHEVADAFLFASWGVDLVKYDNCFLHYNMRDLWIDQVYKWDGFNNFTYYLEMQGVGSFATFQPNEGGQVNFTDAYELMGLALNATGRPILYSISPLTSGCNISTARFYEPRANMVMNQCPQQDSTDDWENLLVRIDNFIDLGVGIIDQPGCFTDLDMLWVGVGGENESNDLRNMDNATVQLLTNPTMLAINQDSGGKAGSRVAGSSNTTTNIFVKNLKDMQAKAAFGVALLNRGPVTTNITLNWTTHLHIPSTTSLMVYDAWANTSRGVFTSSYATAIGPHDTALLQLTII